MIDQLEPLSGEHPFRVVRPPFSEYVDRIRRDDFFSLAKINHGFWELELELRERPPGDTETERRDRDRRHNRRFFLETGFREELLTTLEGLPVDDPHFVFATSHVGYPGSDRIEGVSRDPRAVISLMQKVLPRGLTCHDGMLWKQAAISGELRALFEVLGSLQVVAVGPKWLSGLGERMGLPRFSHLAVPEREARGRREQILAAIRSHRESLGAGAVAILFEAGSLAPWLIARLHGQLANTHLLDVGRALDVCRPDVLFRYNWGRVFRRELSAGMGIEDPRRPDLRRIFAASPRCDGRALEERMAVWLGLPAGRRIVLCRSSAAARRALAGLERRRAGRSVRMVFAGPVSGASDWESQAASKSAAYDARATPDLEALERIPLADYDVVVAADPFGFAPGLEPLAGFCERRGKILLCDGSEALDLPDRRNTFRPPEALAFDGSRPWSVGAGGAIVVDAEDEALARAIVSGDRSGGWSDPLVADRSIGSDVVARIARRLSEHGSWSVRWHLQYQRVVKLAGEVGLEPLGPERTLERTATPSRVPLLAAASESQRGAASRRVVFVPCDPGLERWTNDELVGMLRHRLVRSACARVLSSSQSS